MTDEPEHTRLIDMSDADARKALLKSESYFDFDLPIYFGFDRMLSKIDAKLSGVALQDVCVGKVGEQEKVNHTIFHSKDGKYAWRPQELINPVLYVSMVHQLTEPDAWKLVQAKFAEYSGDQRIECVSLPLISNSEKKTDKATTILSWWQEVEQRSLSLSLEYEYVIHTDVTDCYGSIYTHSIPWALHGKSLSKKKPNDQTLLGNQLDRTIRWSRNNQTNGIPQGSALTNLIAEMVLGYSDMLLAEAIKEKGIEDFFVLRYRDDYRIFSNNPADAEAITKLLAEVLRDLGMKLNPSKTSISSEVIKSSIKQDKMHWIGKEKRKRNLVKHLLLIHELSSEHPNSGSVAIALSKFQRRISKVKETKEPILPMVGVLTDIAIHNPRVYPSFSAILSKLVALSEPNEREWILELVLNKFRRVPYSGHVHIWMQRFSLPMGVQPDFLEPLCKALENPDFELWNSTWLNPEMRNLLRARQYIEQEELGKLSTVIPPEEVQMFENGYY
ncbi:Reverse transcriptase (RNA-dependent DNA polymerase) [Litoreibacter ascidiaceicola]|uniref:Reverse transcriptase (RNA-dependent DNA polymerase) n=1 Tax=Litoreibacter ascidiaceicola TaxID=1486859 RepID=A0A1M5EX69_9RHOB|nr:RNA-directed DNA polymerase [Litoreibacter ascidiaceicola]SHF83797.1 Reverse transcriptase (RNA-dependent DNA polymerase) [Litoreibacter ascidiaceicola]